MLIQQTNTEQKALLRAYYRSLRRNLTPDQRQEAAVRATKQLLAQDVFKRSKRIACYLSVQSELDTSSLINAIWQHGKECYLPVLSNQQSGYMAFYRYQAQDLLTVNQFNIPEPAERQFKIEPSQLDILVLPLVAFDTLGHRLGAGGGYYDKTLADLSGQSKPLRIGWAYSIQQAESLPTMEWDINLHAVVTENEYRVF